MTLATAKRIVIKLGTQVVIDDDVQGPSFPRLKAIVGDTAALLKEGREVLIVSSGAVGLGRKTLKLIGPLELAKKQACAAVGQSLLMNTYRDLFAVHGFTVAQILVTSDDFSERERYLNLRSTLTELLALKVVPIINENDTVSAAGLRESAQRSFDDNDKLSALVAAKLETDLLIMLTNVDGVYTDNPLTNPNAQLVSRIDDLAQLGGVKAEGTSALGRGGMASKLKAARIVAMCGVHGVIASGFVANPVCGVLAGGRGTHIVPHLALSGRQRWIGLSSGYSGIVVVDQRARDVLTVKKSSLLPVGVVGVDGTFEAKEIVSVQDPSGREIGRGISEVSSTTLKSIKGLHSKDLRQVDPNVTREEVIHRDNLVIFDDVGDE